MDIPTNEQGRFEVVDGDGVVVGEGTIDGGEVAFVYAPSGAPATLLPRAEFESVVEAAPQFRYLTFRAAEG